MNVSHVSSVESLYAHTARTIMQIVHVLVLIQRKKTMTRASQTGPRNGTISTLKPKDNTDLLRWIGVFSYLCPP